MADDPADVSAARDAYAAGRDMVVNVTPSGGSQAKSGVRLDAEFSVTGYVPGIRYIPGISVGIGDGNLIVKNIGSEAIYDFNIELPGDIQELTWMDNDFPLRCLPAGKSVSTGARLAIVAGSRIRYFNLTVTGKTADGTPVREEVLFHLPPG